MVTSRRLSKSAPPSSLLVAQLARSARRMIENAGIPAGLRPREMLALRYLRDRGPSAQQGLMEFMRVDATNLVALLNSLEDAGMVDRRRDRADRRRAIVAISEQGMAALTSVDHAFTEIDDELFAGLTASERKTLTDLLKRAVDHIAACGLASGPAC